MLQLSHITNLTACNWLSSNFYITVIFILMLSDIILDMKLTHNILSRNPNNGAVKQAG